MKKRRALLVFFLILFFAINLPNSTLIGLRNRTISSAKLIAYSYSCSIKNGP